MLMMMMLMMLMMLRLSGAVPMMPLQIFTHRMTDVAINFIVR